MHIIDDYIFDPGRLIFYRKDLPNFVKHEIQNTISISDKYEKLIAGLDKLDAKNCSVQDKPIDLIGICLTYNCSLRCNYCSYSSSSGNIDDLSMEDVTSFVVQAIKKRVMYNIAAINKKVEPLRFFFTGGGEPTHNWNRFKEIVTAIKDKCQEYHIPYYFELTTNGMLNDNKRNFIKSNFDKVMISYDGISEIQNKNRPCANERKTSSSIVEKTIKAFIDSSLEVTIRSTVWYYDFKRMKEMCDNLASNFNHFSEWSIMPIIPSGRALDEDNIREGYDIKKYSFFDYYIGLVDYAKMKKYNLYISTPVFNNTVSEYCCGAIFADCFWLMPDRSIINCIESERFRVEVGKIENSKVNLFSQYEDPYIEIVKSGFIKCRDCLAYRFCKGGCPLKSIRDQCFGTGYKQYECSMVQQYWTYIFQKILNGEECFGWRTEKITNERLVPYQILKLVKKEENKNED